MPVERRAFHLRLWTLPSPESWQYAASGDPTLEQSDSEAFVWRDSFGCLLVTRVKSADGDHYRLRLADDVTVDVLPGRQLAVTSKLGVPGSTIEHFLADQVLPRVMADDGHFILHSGAFRRDDGAILLMGPSGRGKSTLATSFDQAGFPLIGDDAMVIDWRRGRPCARPVYPSLRLLPDSIAALFAEPVRTTPVAHYTAKRRISLPIAAGGAGDAAPIGAIFVIAEPSNEIRIRRLREAEACIAFIENSFALDPSDHRQALDRLKDASALANRVPAFEIGIPRDYARLAGVRSAIIETARCAERDRSDDPQ